MSSTDPTGDPASYPPPPAPASTGRPWTIGGFVCAIAALIIIPILFGPVGAVFGILGYRKGDPLGRWAAIAAIVAMVIGMILGAILLGSSDDEALALLRT